MPPTTLPSDLATRIWFTLAALLVFRLGSHLPLPGIGAEAFARLLSPSAQPALAGLVPTNTAVARVSIFSLGVMPYVSSCILLHAAAAFYTPLRVLRRQGPQGWLRFNQYVRVWAAVLAALQAYGVALGLENVPALVPQPGLQFQIGIVVTLVAGSMFLMWLGEQVFARGVTDGIWLLFAADLIVDAPANVAALFEATRTGLLPAWTIPAAGAFLVALVALIVLVEQAERRLPVGDAGSERARGTGAAGASGASFRLDNTGVLAPATASAVLLFIAAGAGSAGYVPGWVASLAEALTPGRPLHPPIFALLIVLLVIFFTRMVINPQAGAEEPAPRPEPMLRDGEHDALLTRLTFIGALYLAVLCVAPELMIRFAQFPFYLGGTSLLVIVLVALNALAHGLPFGRRD